MENTQRAASTHSYKTVIRKSAWVDPAMKRVSCCIMDLTEFVIKSVNLIAVNFNTFGRGRSKRMRRRKEFGFM